MEPHRDKAIYRVKRQYILTYGYLLLERIWNSARIFLCLIGLFLSLTFVGLWDIVHPYVHLASLIGFVGAVIFSLHLFWVQFQWPVNEDILASLERRNNLQHRPLRSMEAQPALDGNRKPTSRHLWALHQERQQKIVKDTKAGWPRITLSSEDKYAFRSAIILLIISGFFVGGAGAGSRIYTAFSPDLSSSGLPIEMDVWTTPPEYTRLPPKLLARETYSEGKTEPVQIILPIGSRIIARVSGGNLEPPSLKHNQENHEFTPLEGTNYELELPLYKSGDLTLEKDGDILLNWQVTILPDAKPNAKLISLPEVTERSAFRLHYSAADDYGVAGLIGRITFQGEVQNIDLKLPFINGSQDVTGKSYYDLTAHPWAGFPVELVLIVRDEADQEGRSKPVSFILPERFFTHPIARALIEQRKKLVEDADGNKQSVAVALSAISLLPESMNNDFTVIMMVSAARGILIYGKDDGSVNDVIDILWDTALRLENGDLNAAEIALREAERALMEALNKGASDAEIKKLVEELKTAMNDFLKAFSKTQEQMANLPGQEGQIIGQKDLENLLDKVDRFARSGARDAARELLSELQDILENLRSARAMPPSSAQQAGQEMLNQLDDMMRRQQNLLDETFRQSRDENTDEYGQSPRQPGPGEKQDGQQSRPRSKAFSDMAGRQEALRQMLGDLMGQMGLNGEIPDSLGNAERSMNEARQELELEEGRRATEAQSNALDQLRQTAQGLAEKLMQGSNGEMVGSGPNGPGRDPLGRPLPGRNGSGQNSDNGFRLQENAISRARLIQDELRRRLSDPARDKLELDYLRRLMERFR
ncbi:MAG: TIGR02302 family protein [Sneathiella sp.]|nr:TIGR02302 family protein [Sneathiella sp.]